MTLCPWERTLRKVTLQPGVVPPLLFLHLSLHLCRLPLSCLSHCSFFRGITGLLSPPWEPFLIFLSVINLHLTDSILLYPVHIFFHLPPCLSPSSIVLSPDAQEAVNWLQEHELHIWKGECGSLLFQAHWPRSHISRIFISFLKKSDVSNLLQSHFWVVKTQKVTEQRGLVSCSLKFKHMTVTYFPRAIADSLSVQHVAQEQNSKRTLLTWGYSALSGALVWKTLIDRSLLRVTQVIT